MAGGFKNQEELKVVVATSLNDDYDDYPPPLSSIGDVSGSVRFSTNDKNRIADEECVSSSSSAE